PGALLGLRLTEEPGDCAQGIRRSLELGLEEPRPGFARRGASRDLFHVANSGGPDAAKHDETSARRRGVQSRERVRDATPAELVQVHRPRDSNRAIPRLFPAATRKRPPAT